MGIFKGIAASEGIAVGEVYLLDREKIRVFKHKIEEGQTTDEIERFLDALGKSKEQLISIKKKMEDVEFMEHLFIIDTHLMILEDKTLINGTISIIERERINAEWALKTFLERVKKIFINIEDEYLRARGSDIDYIGDRVLANLVGKQREGISKIKEKVVIVAHDLSPADTVQMKLNNIIGFATEIGGKVSHTAIVARAQEIPAVVGVENITGEVNNGDFIIVDGSEGLVIINPSEDIRNEYIQRQNKLLSLEKELEIYRKLKSETKDGFKIRLAANIEMIEEIPNLWKYGADGIGLYRTEYLFLNRKDFPGEEEQFQNYRKVLEMVYPHGVTIRTLDLGGDKFFPTLNESPAMGLRAIRFCLKRKEIFVTQLRALLRASIYGNLKIIFPMISNIDEILEVKKIMEEVKKQLRTEKIPFHEKMPIGMIMEVPSATVMADLFAKEVDFFSIGTNDLIQYLLAIDRIDEHVAYLYEPLHPAVLRIIKRVVDAAHEAGIEVAMCGEMAGDPIYALILVGLSLEELSMNASSIPKVKKIIQNISYRKAKKIVEEIFQFSTAQEIESFLKESFETCRD